MTEIYRAGSQLIKVRAVMWVSLALALAAIWWGWDMFSSYGLRPADGGALAPFGTRLALGLGLAAAGIALAAGMWLYGRLYVGALHFDADADRLHFRTTGFVGGATIVCRRADLIGSTYWAGQVDGDGGGVSVNAPWFTIRLKGRRLPLILDAQGQVPDRALIANLLRL